MSANRRNLNKNKNWAKENPTKGWKKIPGLKNNNWLKKLLVLFIVLKCQLITAK